jgi:hypothetical protein
MNDYDPEMTLEDVSNALYDIFDNLRFPLSEALLSKQGIDELKWFGTNVKAATHGEMRLIVRLPESDFDEKFKTDVASLVDKFSDKQVQSFAKRINVISSPSDGFGEIVVLRPNYKFEDIFVPKKSLNGLSLLFNVSRSDLTSLSNIEDPAEIKTKLIAMMNGHYIMGIVSDRAGKIRSRVDAAWNNSEDLRFVMDPFISSSATYPTASRLGTLRNAFKIWGDKYAKQEYQNGRDVKSKFLDIDLDEPLAERQPKTKKKTEAKAEAGETFDLTGADAESNEQSDRQRQKIADTLNKLLPNARTAPIPHASKLQGSSRIALAKLFAQQFPEMTKQFGDPSTWK